MKLLLVLLALAVAAAGSLLVAGHAARAAQARRPMSVLLTPDTGLMPEVTVSATRPEMVVDEVLVTAPRPEHPSGQLCSTDTCVSGPLAN